VVHRIIGVDREQAMLAMARQRSAGMSNVDIREGSLEQLPIEDASIDLALCMLVLHHVDSPAAVFQEVKRVLRPTGLLLVLDMMAHEREELRMNMGHRHLGFSREHFSRDAAMGLVLERYQPLPDSPETLGPPLFIARFSRT
jgi:ArsR family transcriptional regulator